VNGVEESQQVTATKLLVDFSQLPTSLLLAGNRWSQSLNQLINHSGWSVGQSVKIIFLCG